MNKPKQFAGVYMFERSKDLVGFQYLPYSGLRISVNEHGEIRDNRGLPIEPSTDDDGEMVIWEKLWFGLKHYKVAFLVAITFKYNHIPLPLWESLTVGFADGNKTNLNPSNLVWLIPEGGIPCKKYLGFNYIPGFTNYAINREGQVVRIRDGFLPSIHQNAGYFKYSIQPDGASKAGSYLRHRLMALAWLKYPATVDKLDVNHLSGVRGDDRLENLEWATRRRNCQHAYENGLRQDNRHVLVRDCKSGKVTEYYSRGDCARALELNVETIRLRVLAKGQPVYPGLLQFKDAEDKSEWRIPINPEAELRRTGVASKILVRDIRTGEVTEFDSAIKCANAIGIGHATVNWQLRKRGDKTRRPHRGYDFKYADDPTEWPEYTDEQISVFLANPVTLARGLIVTDTQTGEEFLYSNAKEAAKSVDRSKTTIVRAATTGILISNRYRAKWI